MQLSLGGLNLENRDDTLWETTHAINRKINLNLEKVWRIWQRAQLRIYNARISLQKKRCKDSQPHTNNCKYSVRLSLQHVKIL